MKKKKDINNKRATILLKEELLDKVRLYFDRELDKVVEYTTVDIGEDGKLVLFFKSGFDDSNKFLFLDGTILKIEKGTQVKRIMDEILSDKENKYNRRDYYSSKRRVVDKVVFIDEVRTYNLNSIYLFIDKVHSYFNDITSNKLLIDIYYKYSNPKNYWEMKNATFNINSSKNHCVLMSQIKDLNDDISFIEILCLALCSISRYSKSSEIPNSLRKSIYLLADKLNYLGYFDEGYNKNKNYTGLKELVEYKDIELIKENLAYRIVKLIDISPTKESKYAINIVNNEVLNMVYLKDIFLKVIKQELVMMKVLDIEYKLEKNTLIEMEELLKLSADPWAEPHVWVSKSAYPVGANHYIFFMQRFVNEIVDTELVWRISNDIICVKNEVKGISMDSIIDDYYNQEDVYELEDKNVSDIFKKQVRVLHHESYDSVEELKNSIDNGKIKEYREVPFRIEDIIKVKIIFKY